MFQRIFLSSILLIFSCSQQSKKESDQQPATDSQGKPGTTPNPKTPGGTKGPLDKDGSNPVAPGSKTSPPTICAPDKIPTIVTKNGQKATVCWDGKSDVLDENVIAEDLGS